MIMRRCRTGTTTRSDANDLHADCYGAIGELRERLRRINEGTLKEDPVHIQAEQMFKLFCVTLGEPNRISNWETLPVDQPEKYKAWRAMAEVALQQQTTSKTK